MTTRFTKMQGLGNDFVVVDSRTTPVELSSDRVRLMGDRRLGIGFDQLIEIGPGQGDALASLRFFNRDGSSAEACGNGTRCAALLLFAEHPERKEVRMHTPTGTWSAWPAGEHRITVDMGIPRFRWDAIPLSEARNPRSLGLDRPPLSGGFAVNMGNPHVVFLVEDADAVDLEVLGPLIENDPLFPRRTNVEVVEPGHPLRMRVWERGAGITRACGTGACAAVVAAHCLGEAPRTATVALDGGQLGVSWREDDRVWLTGEARVSFRGEFPPCPS